VTPGPRGTYAVFADIAAGNSYNAAASTPPWQCNLAVQSADTSQCSSAAVGYANTRGYATVGITGRAFLSPGSRVVIVCHNYDTAHTVYGADVDLTLMELKSGFDGTFHGRSAHRYGLPADRRIMNRFPKTAAPGSLTTPVRFKGQS
jgi:hypothetical protein